MAAPRLLLLDFFCSSTKELNECKLDRTLTLAQIRTILLTTQRNCLDQSVTDYNNASSQEEQDQQELLLKWTVERLQIYLKQIKSGDELDSEVRASMDAMNEAARVNFCRLVLYSESLRGLHEQTKLKTSEPMTRSDIIEFCGLVNTATRLPNIQRYLRDGASLFDETLEDDTAPSTDALPHKRFEFIQRLLLQAVGYEPDHGSAEIKRIFFTDTMHDLSEDSELVEIFEECMSNMKAAVTEATVASEQLPSDQEKGGVTRVVSVNFSEKMVDPSGATLSSDQTVPSSQSMEQQTEDRQKQQLKVAQQASVLQQEILRELLNMPEEDRQAKLVQAQEASEDFIRKAAEIPGPERVAFLRSINAETQRLMLMHRLWTGMLSARDG